MVEVRGVTGRAAAGPARGARAPAGAFRLGPASGGAEAAPAQGAAAPQGVALLALQEAAPAAERDARARRRGQALLKELSALQAGLLAGRVDPARLRALAALSGGDPAADPALAAILAAISLRARVELARLGMEGALPPD
jgi:hypothetical protein